MLPSGFSRSPPPHKGSTAVFIKTEPCGKTRACEHTLKMYGIVFCTRLTRGCPVQRLSSFFRCPDPRSNASLPLRHETADVKPKAIPGAHHRFGRRGPAGLLPQLEAYPDATEASHCQLWEAAHDIEVSSATMSRAIKRLNWTRKKKTIRASEQSRIGEGTLLSLRKCPGSDLFAARIIDREHIDPLIQAFEQQVVQDWPSIGI